MIYKKHEEFENACYERTYHMLDGISEEEMRTYIGIQKQLNRAFKLDVEESRQLSGNSGCMVAPRDPKLRMKVPLVSMMYLIPSAARRLRIRACSLME